MKRYTITFADTAKADIFQSYEWGCRVWGERQAQRWARELRNTVKRQLTHFPESFPIAPESEESSQEIRQMVVERYRVLFTIQGKKVHVLHVRGAYIGDVESEIDED